MTCFDIIDTLLGTPKKKLLSDMNQIRLWVNKFGSNFEQDLAGNLVQRTISGITYLKKNNLKNQDS